MQFIVTEDAREFERCAWTFLESRLECNLLATVLLGVLGGRFRDDRPLFGYEVNDAGAVTAAALRTRTMPLLCSSLAEARAPAVLDVWLSQDPDLSGVNAELPTAQALSRAWAQRTGGTTHLRQRTAIHALEEVRDPPRRPAGRLRSGVTRERDLYSEWWRAFAEEAHAPVGRDPVAAVDALLEGDSLWVWDDQGPVSLVARSPAVASVVRLGPVYTPPDLRRRGYATTAVAGVSANALAAGAHACMLFTDLANPTSNKIYAEVGYQPIAEWEEHRFESAKS